MDPCLAILNMSEDLRIWKSEFAKTKNGSRFTKISLEFCDQDPAESRKNETKSLQSQGHMKQASSLPRNIETEVYRRKIAIIQKGWLKQILIWYIDLWNSKTRDA